MTSRTLPATLDRTERHYCQLTPDGIHLTTPAKSIFQNHCFVLHGSSLRWRWLSLPLYLVLMASSAMTAPLILTLINSQMSDLSVRLLLSLALGSCIGGTISYYFVRPVELPEPHHESEIVLTKKFGFWIVKNMAVPRRRLLMVTMRGDLAEEFTEFLRDYIGETRPEIASPYPRPRIS